MNRHRSVAIIEGTINKMAFDGKFGFTNQAIDRRVGYRGGYFVWRGSPGKLAIPYPEPAAKDFAVTT
jgi:hypothetical protein